MAHLPSRKLSKHTGQQQQGRGRTNYLTHVATSTAKKEDPSGDMPAQLHPTRQPWCLALPVPVRWVWEKAQAGKKGVGTGVDGGWWLVDGVNPWAVGLVRRGFQNPDPGDPARPSMGDAGPRTAPVTNDCVGVVRTSAGQ